MSSYSEVSRIYDYINSDIDYSKWADFIEKGLSLFGAERPEPELVLDLACGTGSLARELALRGYDMTGVDLSPEMLDVARNKCTGLNVLWLCQDMRSFELFGTVGAVVCSLDSVNHMVDDGDLEKCFKTVRNYLVPGGVFIFDINTRYRFENVYGNEAYILPAEGKDGEDILCAWQNEYDGESKICDFELTLFVEDTVGSGSYGRYDEEWSERYYSRDEICRILDKCGFCLKAISAASDGEILPKALSWNEKGGKKCEKIHFAAVAV